MIRISKYPNMTKSAAKALRLVGIVSDDDLARLADSDADLQSVATRSGIDPSLLRAWSTIRSQRRETSILPRLTRTLLPSFGRVAKWGVTTAVAAMLGVAATSFYSRAVPEVRIEGIRITSQLDDRFSSKVQVSVPDPDLTLILERNAWVPYMRSVMPLDNMLTALTDAHDSLKQLVDSLSSLQSDWEQLELLLENKVTQRNAEKFFDLWERHDGVIYGSIRGQYHTGTFELPDKFLGDMSVNPYQDIGDPLLLLRPRQDSEWGEFWQVSKKGGLYNSTLLPEATEDYRLSWAMAHALAYQDTGFLRQCLRVLEQEISSIEEQRAAYSKIEKSIQGLSRWSASLVLVNKGSTPISFSPEAELYINTREVTGFGDKYVTIKFEHRNSRSELEPITVQGGQAIVAQYFSAELVSAESNWEELLAVFNANSRDAFVQLHAEPQWRFFGKDVYSEVVNFGNIPKLDLLSNEQIADVFE